MFSGVPNGPLRLSPPQVHAAVHNSGVIVVQNKIDQRQRSLPTAKYRAQFPNIVDFVDVSCTDGYEDTVNKLRQTIKQAVQKLPQVGDELPVEWVNIRKDLKAVGRDHITYEEYREICSPYNLPAKRIDHLSRYFHDLGVTVHYHKDRLLKNFVVLNPDWAVDGVYNVLDTRSIEERQGRFTTEDLDT